MAEIITTHSLLLNDILYNIGDVIPVVKYVDETGEEKIASAGEKITIKTEESAIELMAVWNKITNIGGSGTYYLLAGANNQYTLGEGSWTVDSDGYTYSGGTKFYVPEDGEYTFTVTQ